MTASSASRLWGTIWGPEDSGAASNWTASVMVGDSYINLGLLYRTPGKPVKNDNLFCLINRGRR
jgi:hypothetical protein